MKFPLCFLPLIVSTPNHSAGFAVLPDAVSKHGVDVSDEGMDDLSNVGGGMVGEGSGCNCLGAGYESKADPAAKSAAELMVRFGQLVCTCTRSAGLCLSAYM